MTGVKMQEFPEAAGFKNLIHFIENSFQKNGGRPCHRHLVSGSWRTSIWNDVREQAIQIAGGLHQIGITNGDRVAIFSPTCQNWTLADLGVLSCGAIVVPVYHSVTTEQASYILKNCGAKAIFVDSPATATQIKSILNKLPELKHIIVFDGWDPDFSKDQSTVSLKQLRELGQNSGQTVYQKSLDTLSHETLCTIIYTSGTTGYPKGAILTHGNFLHQMDAMKQTLQFKPEYEHLLFLPLAHIFARILQYSQLGFGFIQCYAESIDRVMDNARELRPHFLASVPRVFEKIKSGIEQKINSAPEETQTRFQEALNTGRHRAEYLRAGKKVPQDLENQFNKIKTAFDPLYNLLGGRLTYFITGGAPIPPEIILFFESAGLVMLEGYGLTETTAAGTVTTFGERRLGSIGKAAPGVDLKIADDGEILLKGKHIFKGYYRDQGATREALDPDGWFHTGDLGKVDEDGFICITGRKKDLIITSGGKNISPQNIESLMKEHPFISQFVVLGDQRKYLVALITLNQQTVEAHARKNGIDFSSYMELLQTPQIVRIMNEHVASKNKTLPSYETIKKFALLPQDFSIAGGELTPTMKIKRPVIAQKYADVVDGLYF